MSRLRSGFLALVLLLLALRPVAAQDGVTRVRDVVYGHTAGMGLIMDVLKPARPNGSGVLVMISGGWVSDVPPENIDLFKPFLKHGQTVFLVCHSSQPRFLLGEIVAHIHRAVRFVRTHAADYAVDPNRLGIFGASSGGHLSTTMGTMGGPGDSAAKDPVERASSRVQAVACFFPPLDFLNYGKPGHTALEFKAVEFVWHVFGVKDKPKEEQERILRGLSPYWAVTKETAPTLIIQGDNDPLVPYEQAQQFMAKLEEAHVPHQLIMRPGKGHGWPGIEKDVDLMADWFDKYLAPGSPSVALQEAR